MENQSVIEDLLSKKEFDEAMQMIMVDFSTGKNPAENMMLIGYWLQAKMGRGEKTKSLFSDGDLDYTALQKEMQIDKLRYLV